MTLLAGGALYVVALLVILATRVPKSQSAIVSAPRAA
jgi:hypothetical protein